MKYFSEIYGLVTDGDPTSENGQLFLAEYLLLKEDTEAVTTMSKQLNNSRIKPGLFHRNPLLIKRTMSHDNLSGIFSFSKKYNTTHRKEIWKYLITHFGTYDNTHGQSEQFSKYLPFNPANFFVWGLAADSILAYLFLPFYLINFVITLLKSEEDTSGKILTWVELAPLQNNLICKLLYKIFEIKMKKQYGESYVAKLLIVYHGNNSKEFPINKITGGGK